MTRRQIDVTFRKWLSKPHWRFDMFHLDEDEWGTWLWTPSGSSAQRADELPRTFNHMNVKLIVPGAWWTAMWNDSGRYDLYVDIITPAAWHGDRVTMVDLDLDVVRSSEGVTIEDEDEFELHQAAFGYPESVISRAQAVTAELRMRTELREEPFGEIGDWRMRQAAEVESSSR